MKYSLTEKRKIINDYLTHKNDYATIKEYAQFHGIPPTTLSYLLKRSDEILADSQDDTQDTTGDIITLSHQMVKGIERVGYTYKQSELYTDYINSRSTHDSDLYHLTVDLIRANGSIVEFYIFNPKIKGVFQS